MNSYPWLAEVVIRRAAKSDVLRQSLIQLLLQKEVSSRPLTLGWALIRLWG